MSLIRRCHACGDHFRPSPDRRHGRIQCRDTVNADVTLPDQRFVCADCRETVVELTRHWNRRDATDDLCSFCDSPATETGRVDLTSIVDERVVSQGRYRLCSECEVVFETFLTDLYVDIDLPDPWTHRPSPDGAVFEREGDLRVETTPLAAAEPRVRLFIESNPVVEAVPTGPPRARAREFVAAFEAFYPDEPRPLGEDVVAGNPGLRGVR
ncbi:hypothetical protein [Haloplanus sp. C73]|uniref:hypothetical protein n=1 Tax=Haloplanus sp. C73 TaxID=3421641 RepID=UPI003EBF6A1A